MQLTRPIHSASLFADFGAELTDLAREMSGEMSGEMPGEMSGEMSGDARGTPRGAAAPPPPTGGGAGGDSAADMVARAQVRVAKGVVGRGPCGTACYSYPTTPLTAPVVLTMLRRP